MTTTFESERLIIKTSHDITPEQLLKYYGGNRAFFEKHEPLMGDSYYTIEYQTKSLEHEKLQMDHLASAYYYYFLKEDPERMIGSMSFCRIRKEPYASTIFGYNIDEAYQGHGYCTEACGAAMEHLFSIAHIHRIESRVLTDNEKSIHVLERLGFFHEGFEKESILIGGRFRDHLRYAYINKKY
ncbi:MAG: GNAT family N-acetyltransferase [Eubacterium sp.]|nr:GNAT family N-acetyltransferase [Eubacterium sp.]